MKPKPKKFPKRVVLGEGTIRTTDDLRHYTISEGCERYSEALYDKRLDPSGRYRLVLKLVEEP